MTETGSSWGLVGHGSAIRALSNGVAAPAHAYLLLGPHRVGKRTVARQFAAALNCEQEVGAGPCGRCQSCRLIERWIHPDVTLLEPEDKERISIDQVRQLRSTLSLRPSQGRWRVVVVRGGTLTEQASDALLKTLEEPCPQVILVLTSHSLDDLPETIVSRCRLVLLGMVQAGDIAHELQRRGIEAAEAERTAALAYGAPGWAIEAIDNPELRERRERLQADLEQWCGASLLERFEAVQGLTASTGRSDKTRTMVIEEIELLMAWWRDVVLAASGRIDAIVNRSSQAEIIATAARLGLRGAMDRLRSVALAGQRIDENVDPRLTLEALAVSLG